MKSVTLGNRPVTLAPRTKIEDFEDDGKYVRVSLKLRETTTDNIEIDAQAFEVDANGFFVAAPDGRPSRTRGTVHLVNASSLGDTHTLKPGWVRIVGDYNRETFEKSAVFAPGKPTQKPDDTNPTRQHYDTDTGIGYKWSRGETNGIARAKAKEMIELGNNSAPIAGMDF